MNLSKGKTKTRIRSIVSILIVASTWIFNMGWLRLLFMPVIAILHSVIFFCVNLYSADYFSKSRRIKVLNGIFVVTYLIAYVFMPDSDDICSYVFWGFVNNENILNIAESISVVAFVGNIVTLVMQIVGIERIKKNSL